MKEMSEFPCHDPARLVFVSIDDMGNSPCGSKVALRQHIVHEFIALLVRKQRLRGKTNGKTLVIGEDGIISLFFGKCPCR